jgi:N-acetylglutamate synthase-like GNAT family acetyltransferase
MPALLPVRPATAADIPALLDLIHSAYRGAASRAGWTTEADLIDGSRTTAALLAEDLADPATALLVAEDDDGLLGCCAVTDRGAGRAYFGTFAVRPTAQAAGVGSCLLAAAEEHARAAGAVRMEMTVLAQRAELLAWYARRHYAPTGERRPFPYGDERYGLPLRDDLEFVVLAASLDGHT